MASSDAGEVMEQPLEVDDDDRLAQLLASYVSQVWETRLIWRTNLLSVLSLIYDLGKKKLKTLLKLWDKMITACGGGDNVDADLINFLTNRYLTDFFSLEKSRKVLCIVGPSRRHTDQANKIATRLWRDTREDFRFDKQLELPEGPADSVKILAMLLGNDGNLAYLGIHTRQDHINKIKYCLRNMSYLIVIPDLRDAKTWEEIESAFPENQMSSRVIITTCRLDVAEECFSGVSDLIHKVKVRHTPATGADGERSAEDEDSGYDTAPEEEEEEEEGDSVGTLLSECTDKLRDCCLYLSTVRDVFERGSMVRKWVAEEIVSDEKMGYGHFAELSTRDVIQEKQQTPSNKFRAEPGYVVNHRMLLGLRQKSEDYNFAAHVDVDTAEEASKHPMVAINKISRLSLSCGGPSATSTSQSPAKPPEAETSSSSFLKRFSNRRKKIVATEADQEQQQPRDNNILLGHARSMTVRGHGKGLLKELDGGKLLVLDLQGCEDLNNSDVVDICERLTLLKYLSIRGTPVSEIPRDIKNLKGLQTLDLRETKVDVLPPEVFYELPALAHLFVSDWLKMTTKQQQQQQLLLQGGGGGGHGMVMDYSRHHLLLGIAVLDIRICHLERGDLDKLGSMIHLKSLALALTGLPTEEMVINKEVIPTREEESTMVITNNKEAVLLFGKLMVFALDSHVPWITFREGAMPELRRLYLWLYAGPPGKTPSGTNHLKKVHEVTLRYSKQYEGSVCVKETTRAMEEQGSMRARPTTLAMNGKVTVLKIQVPSYSRQTLGWLVRKLMHNIFTPLLSFAPVLLRHHLAQITERQLLLLLPLLALFFCCLVTLLIMLAPLLLKVAIWLARRSLHAMIIDSIYSRFGNAQWTQIIFAPVAAYHIVSIFTLAYYYISPPVLLVCAALLWFPSLLMRIAMVYILTPLWRTLLLPVFSVLAPLFFSLVLIGTLQDPPDFLPRLPTSINVLVPSLAIPAVWYYFFPQLFYSAVTGAPTLVRTVAEWFLYGP